MEMPSYKWPSPRTVVMRVAERAWIFLRTAGSLILAISIVVWAAAYYPHNPSVVRQELQQKRSSGGATGDRRRRMARAAKADSEEKLAQLNNEIAAKYQQHSILGWMGKAIEPAVRPLGWDWRIGCAVIASFPGPGGRRGDLGRRLRAGREVRDRNRPKAAGRWAPDCSTPYGTGPLGRCSPCRWPFRSWSSSPLLPVRRDAGGDPPGNEQLALAGLCLQLHDGAGLFRRLITYQVGTWLQL